MIMRLKNPMGNRNCSGLTSCYVAPSGISRTTRKFSPANIGRREEILKLLGLKYSYREIAEALGVSYMCVVSMCRRMGEKALKDERVERKSKRGYFIKKAKGKNFRFEGWVDTKDGKKYIGTFKDEIAAKTACIVYKMKEKR